MDLRSGLQRCHNEVLRHVAAGLLRADLDALADGVLRGADVKNGDALGAQGVPDGTHMVSGVFNGFSIVFYGPIFETGSM